MALTVLTAAPEGAEKVLSRDALGFLETLCRQFNPRREELLAARAERQKAFDRGEMPDFLPSTKAIRGADWKVAPTPKDLQKRHVEITGPVTEDDDQRLNSAPTSSWPTSRTRSRPRGGT